MRVVTRGNPRTQPAGADRTVIEIMRSWSLDRRSRGAFGLQPCRGVGIDDENDQVS